MKIKKRILSLALAGALTLGLLPALSSPALAADGDSTYTLTIPSELNVANSGWNATTGISATGMLERGKKLTVTASSANSWALKSGDNSVGYKLATESADTEATTSWEFIDLSSTAATKPMGIIVANYDDKPAGTYTDTVTFTASVVPATKKFTLAGKGYSTKDFSEITYSIEIEYTDDDTWGDMVTKYDELGTFGDGYILLTAGNNPLKHNASTHANKFVSSTEKVSNYSTDGYSIG